MKKDSIDIFIPYWGDPDLLMVAIESVFGQKNKNWTLTVIDDGYPEKSAQKYCRKIKDTRFKYIRNEKNLGITKNFNQCVHLTKAKYVLIMGCDDVLLPNYIDRVLENIGEADFYQPGVDVIDAYNKKHLPLADITVSYTHLRAHET